MLTAGSEEAVKRAERYIKSMAHPEKYYLIPGGLGKGSDTKMVHQLLCGVQIAASLESMSLAARAGLDTQKVFDTVVNGPAWSWMYDNRASRMLKDDYKVLSALSIIAKDVVSLSLARSSHYFPSTLPCFCSIFWETSAKNFHYRAS